MESVHLFSQVPQEIQRIFVSYLREYKSYNSVYVVGRVVFRHPHYAGAAGAVDISDHIATGTARIKLNLQEPETGELFSALIFGQLSYDVSCGVSVGSRLVFSGFQTEPNRTAHATGSKTVTAAGVPLIVLGRERNLCQRIWRVLQPLPFSEERKSLREKCFDGVIYSSLNEKFAMTHRCNFYGVARRAAEVDEKSKSVTVDIADPSVASLACRIKNCRLKTVCPLKLGDVLRVQNASVLSYIKTPCAIAFCKDVVVLRADLRGESVEAVSMCSSAKLPTPSQDEIDAVVELARWYSQQRLRNQEESNQRTKASTLHATEPQARLQSRLSCLAELRTVKVTCVVVAVHRIYAAPDLRVFLTVWDGTRPEFLTGLQPPSLPANAALVRRDDAAWTVLGPQLISVSVARPWARIAAALPLGAHVLLNGLTVRRGTERNRWWVVLETRFSRQGITVLTKPCTELRESMEALLALGDCSSEVMDISELTATAGKDEGRPIALGLESCIGSHQPHVRNEQGNVESDDELFSSYSDHVSSDVSLHNNSSESLFGTTTDDEAMFASPVI